jgi:hypothetical protein
MANIHTHWEDPKLGAFAFAQTNSKNKWEEKTIGC